MRHTTRDLRNRRRNQKIGKQLRKQAKRQKKLGPPAKPTTAA